MSSAAPPLKRITIEWRYPANLNLYGRMDAFGHGLRGKFPDWERSALSLELRHRPTRTRFAMGHNRCFYDCVAITEVDAASSIRAATELFERFASDIEVTDIVRIGMRQCYSFSKNATFSELVSRSKRAFLPNAIFAPMLDSHLDDVALVIDLTDRSGDWKFNVRGGPMKKDQWLQTVEVERKSFMPGDFDLYKQSIPEQMLYIDIDASKEHCLLRDSFGWLSRSVSQVQDYAVRLNEYFDGV